MTENEKFETWFNGQLIGLSQSKSKRDKMLLKLGWSAKAIEVSNSKNVVVGDNTNDLKFMASDGNMYPAEWFAVQQSYDEHDPPKDVLVHGWVIGHTAISLDVASHWTLRSCLPKPAKIK